MPSRRIAKVNRAILEALSAAILFELRDPRVKNVTILNVETTDDLKASKVRVGVRGDAKIQSLTLHGLESSRGFLQSKIAERLETRYTPILKFILEPNWLDHLTATSQGFLEASATAIEIEGDGTEPTDDDDTDDDDTDDDDTD
ncbi:MAG: ribosome-binding factor A, partial [Planctomycetota bacterium]